MFSKKTEEGIWLGITIFIVVLTFVEVMYPGLTLAAINFIFFPKVIQ